MGATAVLLTVVAVSLSSSGIGESVGGRCCVWTRVFALRRATAVP